MTIRLPWINEPIDTENPPENFDQLVEESFRKFTEGTAIDYRFEDKLCYLDNLREKYLTNGEDDDEAVTRLIGEAVKYNLEEYGESLTEDDLLSVEFMEQCYREGSRRFHRQYDRWSHSRSTRAQKIILRIIQIVVNYSEDE